jgi:hypothetical protein
LFFPLPDPSGLRGEKTLFKVIRNGQSMQSAQPPKLAPRLVCLESGQNEHIDPVIDFFNRFLFCHFCFCYYSSDRDDPGYSPGLPVVR